MLGSVPENPVIDCKIIDLSYFACLMAAISVFTTSTISKVDLNDTNMVTCRATDLKPIWLTLSRK